MLLGGARSGKSRLAQQIASKYAGSVLFVATGAPLDDEMRSRIEIHKKQRPPNWRTLEATQGLGQAIKKELRRAPADVVVIDCITLLVSNLLGEESEQDMIAGSHYELLDNRVSSEIREIIDCIAAAHATFVVVSNEVGMGVVPMYASARAYRDLLGKANQMLAESAGVVYLMVAGLPWQLKGPARI